MTEKARIVVAGAGSIGCFVGGCLALDGRDVSLLGRGTLAERVIREGLRLTDNDGLDRAVPADEVKMGTDPSVLVEADIVLVAVKSGGTSDMADLISEHARPDALIVSLQNGVTNVEKLKSKLPDHDIRAGMVGFNVVQLDNGAFHRGTTGELVVEAGDPDVSPQISSSSLACITSDDMPGVQWGKLLINLNNALNALSGLPLKEQLSQRAWRKIMAAQMVEGMTVLQAAGITPKPATPLPPPALPPILRLPTFLFKIIAGGMLKIDAKARSSMWEDLERRRRTEIDELQGAIVRLGATVGVATPIAEGIVEQVKAAEAAGNGSPRLLPDQFPI